MTHLNIFEFLGLVFTCTFSGFGFGYIANTKLFKGESQ